MAETGIIREFSQPKHKHAICIATALNAAAETCRVRGQRLTPIRRRVLELVWENHGPVKAYDILASLQKEQRRSAPPTVYRALDFLLEEGLVHKIESLNAYVGCGEPGHSDSGQFLICRECGEVAEMDDPDLVRLLAKKARRLGFEITKKVIEVKGTCSACRREN